eukprot:168311-Rhodomonas_salina.5
MPGTDVTSSLRASCTMPSTDINTSLRACYAMSGTDVVYGAAGKRKGESRQKLSQREAVATPYCLTHALGNLRY